MLNILSPHPEEPPKVEPPPPPPPAEPEPQAPPPPAVRTLLTPGIWCFLETINLSPPLMYHPRSWTALHVSSLLQPVVLPTTVAAAEPVQEREAPLPELPKSNLAKNPTLADVHSSWVSNLTASKIFLLDSR